MGVQNLWTLLEPCGRRIDIKALRGKKLAIDASVWIFRFIKAMRDEQGELLPNAHLVGFLRRICKLLYLNIRPVFVFDGSTPALKRQTLLERRRRREVQDARVRKTAEKLLMNRLKQHALLELQRVHGEDEKTKPSSVVLAYTADQKVGDGNSALDANLKKLEEQRRDTSQDKKDEAKAIKITSNSDSSSVDDDLAEFEVDLEEGVDPVVLSTLPPSMQLDIMLQVRERAMAAARGGFEERSGKPSDFSEYQMAQYLNSTGLRRKLDAIRGGVALQHNEARPIAAEEGKEYILLQQSGSPKAELNSTPSIPHPVADTSLQKAQNESKQPLNISFFVAEDELESGDDMEWEDVESEQLQAVGKSRASRSKFWSLSHGFQKGRSLGKWSDNDDEQRVMEEEASHTEEAMIQEAIKRSLLDHRNSSVEELDLESCDIPDGKGIEIDRLETLERSTWVPVLEAVGPGVKALHEVNKDLGSNQNVANVAHKDEKRAEDTITMERNSLATSTLIQVGKHEEAFDDEANAVPASAMSDDSENKEGKLGNLSPSLNINETENSNIQRIGNIKKESTASSHPIRTIPIKAESHRNQSVPSVNPTNNVRKNTGNVEKVTGAVEGSAHGAPQSIQPLGKTIVHPQEEVIETKTQDAFASDSREAQNQNTLRTLPEEIDMDQLAREESMLRAERRAAGGQSDSPTDQMFTECQELLQLFGIPFIIAPTEAEAQCAWLDSTGLVDGVVTDDNDSFLFGAKKVYRHIFDENKYVEEYRTDEIEKELGLNREKFISLALLLGSDYTTGIAGVGIVNAVEIVSAFSGYKGLCEFEKWVSGLDEDILNLVGDKSIAQANEKQPQTQFKKSHRSARKTWLLPDGFPSKEVIEAYWNPSLDTSKSKFTFAKPDFEMLTNLCQKKLGWDHERTKELLVPVQKVVNEREKQQTLENFVAYRERFAKIRSKRLAQAVSGILNRPPADLVEEDVATPSKRRKERGKSRKNNRF